jgi:hypothetical protein
MNHDFSNPQVFVHTCGLELINLACRSNPSMLQSATLAKGAVTGKRTSTHSCHPWIAAISTATLPFCLKEEYHGERCQINIQEFRVKIRLSVSQ